MRNWLEGKRWYWYSLTINFHPFPWHWEKEFWNHSGWLKVTFGPVGFILIKAFKEDNGKEVEVGLGE